MLEFLGERVLGVFDTSSTFLVFNDNGTEVLVAKTPVKIGMSWDSLHKDNVAYGNMVLEIDRSYYSVSLIRGGNSHVTVSNVYYGFNTAEYQSSEWNRYMYPIHSTNHTNSNNLNTTDMGTLAQYSDADLLVNYEYDKGSYSWCQEVSGVDSTNRVLRGYGGVTVGSYDVSSYTNTSDGWRPLLIKLDIGV